MSISIIQVIDVPCGGGKTSWAIQYMNEHTEKSFIYCTPFLDEIDRVRKACGSYSRFDEPRPYTGSKIDSFNELLADGKDIAVTHTTFLNATQETLDLVRTGSYELLIDEALDVVVDFNRVQTVESAARQMVTRADVVFLLERGIIKISEDNRVVWCGGEYGDDFKFSEVRRFANLGRLFCVGESLFLAVFPPEMFKCFDTVYIMTYMFSGSIFKYYLDMFGLDYELKSVKQNDGGYYLTDYDAAIDTEFRRTCKSLIHVCDYERLNLHKVSALSKSWYDNNRKDDRLKELKTNLTYYFRRYLQDAKASNGDIMWTCYGDYERNVSGRGYTMVRAMTESERRLPQNKREELEKQLSCFVPCNAKATNIYRNRWALAYCVNMYLNPMIRRFFTDENENRERNGLPCINPDENAYALSCLLQWIFRSRIRDGKEIELYIPSCRMRGLLTDWLDGLI